ncbi:MAG: metal-dependent hydrolase [Myxococcota bacterium]|nr:metal-dependent hydrolase [Myxococcota bacterium]
MTQAITVRRPRAMISNEIPRHWYGDDPFATHFLDALSSVFPDGEAFFVKSVLRYRDRIDDPELLGRIRAFAGQEGQHSHQHDLHVQLMDEFGYSGIRARNRIMIWVLDKALEHFPLASLASTVALEHLTAILARKIMSEHDTLIGPMDPRMAELWTWHAVEESEHKAVAFDVYKTVAPDNHALLVVSLIMNTIGMLFDGFDRAIYMLWRDGLLFRRDVWGKGLRFLFGKGGLLRGLGAGFWPFFRRGFHPDDVDDTALLEHWRARIETSAPALARSA